MPQLAAYSSRTEVLTKTSPGSLAILMMLRHSHAQPLGVLVIAGCLGRARHQSGTPVAAQALANAAAWRSWRSAVSII